MKIAVIGLGNVGMALGRGMALLTPNGSVGAYDPHPEKRQAFQDGTGWQANETSEDLVTSSEFIFLCVRTSQVSGWVERHARQLDESKALVCLSGGITTREIAAAVVGPRPVIVRAVTNINIAVRAGFTVLLEPSAPDHLSRIQKDVEQIFEGLGTVVVAQTEAELDLLSVLPGCAPAATAIFVEALTAFGVSAGFDAETAERTAIQCVGGTIDALRRQQMRPATLKRMVAAPGGVVDRLLDAPESRRLEENTMAWFDVVRRSLMPHAS